MYIEYEIQNSKDTINIIQLVLVKSFQYEFDIPPNILSHIPVSIGEELTLEGETLFKAENKIYRSSIGKLIFLIRYYRLYILYIVRDLSK